MTRHGFRIELTADGGLTQDEAIRALRSFLKVAWRCHRLKCTSAEPITHGSQEAIEDDTTATIEVERDE